MNTDSICYLEPPVYSFIKKLVDEYVHHCAPIDSEATKYIPDEFTISLDGYTQTFRLKK